MCAASADFPTTNPYQPGPITSPAMFQDVLEDALFDTRRFFDANPGMWVYQSLVGILDGLAQVTVSGQRPSPENRQTLESVVPPFRAQADHADPALLQRIDALWAYFIEWPAGPAPTDVVAPDAENDDAHESLIEALDAIVVGAHSLRTEMKRARIRLKEQRKAGSLVARAAYQTLQAADSEMKQMLAAIDSFAELGVLPGGHGASATPDGPSRRQLAHYAAEQAGRIVQLRRSFAAWRKRSGNGSGAAEVASFDHLLSALHQSIQESGELAKVAPEHPAMPKLIDGLTSILSRARSWISDLEMQGNRETPIAETLADDLDLLDWPQLPKVQKGVRMLAEMVQVWTQDAMPYFRANLYETVIELDLLRTLSATKALDAVGWNVQQLVYMTTGGKEPAPHERREVRLDDAIKRELAIYASPVLAGFLARLRAIDAFWRRWTPPAAAGLRAKSKPAELGSYATPLSRHEAEQAALRAIHASTAAYELPSEHDVMQPSGGVDPIATARAFSPEYFRHILDTSIRDISKLPMKFAFSRGLAMQLRAIRLATGGKRIPTIIEQETIGRGFTGLSRIIPGVDNASDTTTLNDAWAAHLYFQLLTGENSAKKSVVPSGMIANPEHFTATLVDLIADVECLLVLFPNSDVWIDMHHQLQRLYQRAQYGRELDASEKQDIERALEKMEAPAADVFANVPAFSSTFTDRLRQVLDYSRGRRAASRPAFEELLRAVLLQTTEILTGRNWDDDLDRLAAIDRQLRAMRRWTTGDRSPTSEERVATRDTLAVVAQLHGLDRMTEWAARVSELATVFHDDLPPNDGKPIAAPADIATAEEFGLIIDETLRDCRSFSGRGLFHKPTGPEMIWAEAAAQLAVLRRMLDQDRMPTQRERAEIHRVLTGIGSAINTSPCPAIHDFLPDITGRLGWIDAYYTWLVTAGPRAGKEVAAIDSGAVRCVTLGGEMRVAFARSNGSEPGIYVCRAEKLCTKEKSGEIDIDVMRYLPTTRDLIRLVACEGWTPTTIRWNAHSDFVAYSISGNEPGVGWCATREAGEKGRVNADAFAWATKGSNLICVSLHGRTIFRLDAETGTQKELATLPPEADPSVAPQIVISPGGDSLTFTCGRAGENIDLCLIEFAGGKPVMRVRKQFPGATAVFPFWSNAGDLGCLIVAPTGGTIISLPFGNGDGDVLYSSAKPMAPTAPAWSANGKFIAFFDPQPSGDHQLALLDCDTREIIPLLKPSAVQGRLSFGEETLAVQGVDAATILWPHISMQRTVTERF